MKMAIKMANLVIDDSGKVSFATYHNQITGQLEYYVPVRRRRGEEYIVAEMYTPTTIGKMLSNGEAEFLSVEEIISRHEDLDKHLDVYRLIREYKGVKWIYA